MSIRFRPYQCMFCSSALQPRTRRSFLGRRTWVGAGGIVGFCWRHTAEHPGFYGRTFGKKILSPNKNSTRLTYSTSIRWNEPGSSFIFLIVSDGAAVFSSACVCVRSKAAPGRGKFPYLVGGVDYEGRYDVVSCFHTRERCQIAQYGIARQEGTIHHRRH